MPRPKGSKNLTSLSKEDKLLRRRIRERAARAARAADKQAATQKTVTAAPANGTKKPEATQVFHIYIGSGAA